jgi:hypothetical protein
MHAEPGPRTHTDPGREAIQAQPAHIPVQTQSPKPRLTYAIRLSERQSDEGFGAAAAEHARHGHGVAHSRGDVESEVRADGMSVSVWLPAIYCQAALVEPSVSPLLPASAQLSGARKLVQGSCAAQPCASWKNSSGDGCSAHLSPTLFYSRTHRPSRASHTVSHTHTHMGTHHMRSAEAKTRSDHLAIAFSVGLNRQETSLYNARIITRY